MACPSVFKQSAVMTPVGARTSVVPVVLGPSSTTIAAILAISSPVGHATQLVALGEGGVWDTIQGGLCGDWGPPSVAIGQRRDDVGNRFRHCGCCVPSSEGIKCALSPARVNLRWWICRVVAVGRVRPRLLAPWMVGGLCKFVKSCRNSMFGGVWLSVAALAGPTTEGGQELAQGLVTTRIRDQIWWACVVVYLTICLAIFT